MYFTAAIFATFLTFHPFWLSSSVVKIHHVANTVSISTTRIISPTLMILFIIIPRFTLSVWSYSIIFPQSMLGNTRHFLSDICHYNKIYPIQSKNKKDGYYPPFTAQYSLPNLPAHRCPHFLRYLHYLR